MARSVRARVGRRSVCLSVVDGTAAVVMTRIDTSSQQSDTHTDTHTEWDVETHWADSSGVARNYV